MCMSTYYVAFPRGFIGKACETEIFIFRSGYAAPTGLLLVLGRPSEPHEEDDTLGRQDSAHIMAQLLQRA